MVSWKTTRDLRGIDFSASRNDSFQFDGATSDLAQQFYHRHQAGAVAAALRYDQNALPAAIKERLQAAGVDFADLPGLLQRALIWDSGFAIAPDASLIKIYTNGGRSMADIAVSLDDYLSVGCTTSNCTNPNGHATFRSKNCTGTQMLQVSSCAAESFNIQGNHMSMWATGGADDAIPVMNIERHAWHDLDIKQDFLVFAIHTTEDENEPSWNNCPRDDVYGSMIIPCAPYSAALAKAKRWKEPAPTKLVTNWLEQVAQHNKCFNTLYLIPIIGGVLLLLGGLGWLWYRRRQLHRELQKRDRQRTVTSEGGTTPRATPYAASTSSSNLNEFQSSTHNGALKVLIGDPNLRRKRIAFEKIELERELSRGAYGEVWLAKYNGQQVAIKRLLTTKRQRYNDVVSFTDEIQLTAALDHPNVVQFIGVAWSSLEQLCMALEFLEKGDLQTFLKQHGSSMTWEREKRAIARDVAAALSYLHSRTPPLIHRDLKSKNVLLSNTLQAKLIDFGVSRNCYNDIMMTAGVGTPFWTAPEVLNGTRYSEKSDIYSLGVVLVELDKCALPYADTATNASGAPLQLFQVLNMVIAGSLRPSVTSDCPTAVTQIINACLESDPEKRPAAADVIQLLDAAAESL